MDIPDYETVYPGIHILTVMPKDEGNMFLLNDGKTCLCVI